MENERPISKLDWLLTPEPVREYILRLDDDETLCLADKELMINTLESYGLSGLMFPRRWLVPPGDRYIATRPWYPDYQLRLICNDADITSHRQF